MNQKAKNRPNRPTKTNKTPPRIKATREYTAGGVVFRRTEGRIDILMIQDRLGRWTIPKGHVEAGESLEQTALREVAEETGLQRFRIGEKLDTLRFFYRKDGKLIFMTTDVFLMEALGDTDTLSQGDSAGIVDVQWFAADRALKLVEYRDTERLFRLSLTKLDAPAPDRPHRRPRRRLALGNATGGPAHE
jgi:8-oxo-dGTP pyrophosphatase MutT (NUDIX family)